MDIILMYLKMRTMNLIAMPILLVSLWIQMVLLQLALQDHIVLNL